MPTDHTFEYQQSFLDDRVWPCCSCGWQAPKDSADLAAAREAWDDHCDAVFMEATMRDGVPE